ncbi:Caax prenyl protease, partial [Thalictrum thalictroides]
MEKLQVEESQTLGFPPIEEMDETCVSKSIAVIACGAMAFLYVAILYSPTVILRLPQPTSLNSFMIRRFVCAIISTILSVILCGFLLP